MNRIVKSFGEFSNENNQSNVSEKKNELFNEIDTLNEIASINLKDGLKSPFDYGKFKVAVLNNEENKEPHFHVISKSEGFNIRIKISDGELLSVKTYGQRKKTDKFTDIVKLAKEWIKQKTSISVLSNITNQQFAYVQFFLMNPDSPFNN